ncbi:hypothetical protein [Bacillus cereus]|uniref:hypothetical protein n=1 Tax=Bacillus cereus TaxID=1396 RepID=UPI000BF65BE5|nr:hypothetical protein [Bacillus cereus]PFA64055.1 hypothetical protein CN403_29830 [Bacillus cereus]
MPDILKFILFILIAISAVGYLLKESHKPKKNRIGILLEFLILLWAIWEVTTIII